MKDTFCFARFYHEEAKKYDMIYDLVVIKSNLYYSCSIADLQTDFIAIFALLLARWGER